MRPSALEVTAGDFALAVGHRRIAIGLLSGTLNSAAAFSSVAASSGALAQPDGFAGGRRRSPTWTCRLVVVGTGSHEPCAS
jgi:hypothetical protein